MKQISLRDLTAKERQALASKVGVTSYHVWQMMVGNRAVTDEMAVALKEAEPRLSMHSLKPKLAVYLKVRA